MTRPARSSNTAGSGMPATTALTAAVSMGFTPRTSSRDAAAGCSRQGTSAEAAMHMKTAAAPSGGNSSNRTSRDSARAATARMMAERRNRSGHGENNEELGEKGDSTAIWPASLFLLVRGQNLHALLRRQPYVPERHQARGPTVADASTGFPT